ncbi:biosynthetic peptidoglycan transglycosylase [Brevundimonas sp. LF-1]|uniref:biosynthetic peptidoglycan transglycosylase n=1 Tax=Brevundimonas sp. LF-1 TaxID=3126100 RepID=UPI0030E2EC52
MRERPTRLKLPSLRRWLIGVHTDLLAIHEHVPGAVYPEQLTLVEKLVLVLEDRRFFDHSGSDLRSVCRELFRALTLQRHGGASTIDMQFVRTVTGRKERTLRRKLYEIMLSKLIQYRYSKIRILRGYLSCAFFGSHLYGSHAASAAMYEKHPDSLNLDEASVIAAMLVYPKPLKPTPKWANNISRRANYGKTVYVRHKEKFDKLKISEPHYI